MAKLTDEQIQHLVNQYIEESFKNLDGRWLSEGDEYFPPRDDTKGYLSKLDVVEDDRISVFADICIILIYYRF